MSGGRPARVPRTALLALITAGCASLPQDMPGLGGRLSLQVAAHAGAPALGVNAAFDLHGNAASGTLKLSTPLGPQLAVARWTDDRSEPIQQPAARPICKRLIYTTV